MSRGRPTFTESNRAIVLISSQARPKSKHISAGADNPLIERQIETAKLRPRYGAAPGTVEALLGRNDRSSGLSAPSWRLVAQELVSNDRHDRGRNRHRGADRLFPAGTHRFS